MSFNTKIKFCKFLSKQWSNGILLYIIVKVTTANKIATQIIDKLFDAGDLQISYFPPATDEEVMVAELARLMTLMSTYEDKEEYEKAAIIKRKIERLQTKYGKL